MKTLHSKIMLFFSGLIVLAGLILSFVVYQASSSLVKKTIGMQAEAIASHVSSAINTDDFKKIVDETLKEKNSGSTEAVLQMPEYIKMREELNKMKEMNGLKYLYTMIQPSPGVNMYVVDGFPMDSSEVSKPGDVEENKYPAMDAIFATHEKQLGELSISGDYGATITAYSPLLDKDGNMIGIVGADFDATNIYQLMRKQKADMMLITLGILVVTILVSYFFAKMLVNPLRRLALTVAKVRQGDLTVHFQTTTKDEVGQLGQAFEEMVGDLSSMIKGIQVNSYSLTQSSQELAASAENASDNTKQFVDQVQYLKEGADKQLRISERVSKTIDQMSAEVRQIADSAVEVHRMSASVTALADQGKNQVADASGQIHAIQETHKESSELMRLLGEKSTQIIQIVDVISGIAKQTNMLALNASIEAARAGEAGKGFAVVAEEVQRLAVESAKAAGHVNELVQDIQLSTKQAIAQMEHSTEQINRGAVVIGNSGQSFLSIIDAIHEVTMKIEAVTNATQLLAAGSSQMVASFKEVEEIAVDTHQATEKCTQFVKHELAMVEAIEASAEELTAMSEQLHELIRKFKVNE